MCVHVLYIVSHARVHASYNCHFHTVVFYNIFLFLLCKQLLLLHVTTFKKKKLVGIIHRKNKKNKSDLITNPHLYALVEHQNFYFRVVFLLISVNMGTPNTFRRVPKQLLDKED